MNRAPEHGPESRLGLSPWRTALIVLLAVGVAVALFVASRPTPEPQSAQSRIERPGEEARALIERSRQGDQDPDLESVYRRAEGFIADGKLTDAHLLLFFAARRGHVLAARELGGMYDPIYFSTTTSIMDEPDPTQAYKWYRRAADGGDDIAQLRLLALKAWVEQAAKQGDEGARLLLMAWK
jgi:hypothetical protein